MFGGMNSFVLLCVPGFILAGNLMNQGGITYRIIDFANSLVGLVAQRLMRKVCRNCSQEMDATPEEQKLLGGNIKKIRRGRGCAQCNNTGYRGRIAVHEIIVVDAALRRMISGHASTEAIVDYAREHQQMRTLRENGLKLVEQGISTPEEWLKISL